MINESGGSFYEVLSISTTASLTEIQQSYRKLAREYHPDRNLDNIEFSTKIFCRISEAYSVLSDEVLRSNYDNKLKSTVEHDPRHNFSFKQAPKSYSVLSPEVFDGCKEPTSRLSMLNCECM